MDDRATIFDLTTLQTQDYVEMYYLKVDFKVMLMTLKIKLNKKIDNKKQKTTHAYISPLLLRQWIHPDPGIPVSHSIVGDIFIIKSQHYKTEREVET